MLIYQRVVQKKTGCPKNVQKKKNITLILHSHYFWHCWLNLSFHRSYCQPGVWFKWLIHWAPSHKLLVNLSHGHPWRLDDLGLPIFRTPPYKYDINMGLHPILSGPKPQPGSTDVVVGAGAEILCVQGGTVTDQEDPSLATFPWDSWMISLWLQSAPQPGLAGKWWSTSVILYMTKRFVMIRAGLKKVVDMPQQLISYHRIIGMTWMKWGFHVHPSRL